MSSNNIYTKETIPYFYIIRHKNTKIMYAGSRWAKGCHPNEFMENKGYNTTSNTIKNIIKKEGLDIFEILRIDTNCDGLSVYDYESLFLQTLNCAQSKNWYNKHNNDNILSIGSLKFEIQMLKKYNVKNANDSIEIQKIKQTNCLKKHGTIYYVQSEEFKQKAKKTMLKKYGVEYAPQLEEFKQKSKETCLEKYGVEHNSQLQEIKDKKIKTIKDKFGVDHAMQVPEIKQKSKETCLKKYGVEFVLQLPEIKQKSKETCLEKYGVEYASQTPKFRNDVKKTCLEKYGVENYAQTEEFKQKAKAEFFSIIETKRTFVKSVLSRFYPEFKIYY